MRCFFTRDGHIQAVEELPDLSDQEAVAKSHQIFEERKDAQWYNGFEVWDLARMVIQYPPRTEAEVIPTSSKKQA